MSGLLNQILNNMALGQIRSKPFIENNVLKIVITEQELKEIAFKGVDPGIRESIDLVIDKGKLIIQVRLI